MIMSFIAMFSAHTNKGSRRGRRSQGRGANRPNKSWIKYFANLLGQNGIAVTFVMH